MMTTEPARRPAAPAVVAIAGVTLIVALASSLAPRARADLAADSPVKFPAEGPLPAKFPLDESAKD